MGILMLFLLCAFQLSYTSKVITSSEKLKIKMDPNSTLELVFPQPNTNISFKKFKNLSISFFIDPTDENQEPFYVFKKNSGFNSFAFGKATGKVVIKSQKEKKFKALVHVSAETSESEPGPFYFKFPKKHSSSHFYFSTINIVLIVFVSTFVVAGILCLVLKCIRMKRNQNSNHQDSNVKFQEPQLVLVLKKNPNMFVQLPDQNHQQSRQSQNYLPVSAFTQYQQQHFFHQPSPMHQQPNMNEPLLGFDYCYQPPQSLGVYYPSQQNQ
uniref:Transmembrane protein n=1 Tax=Coptotermes formosanus TaxID=36987 RepID=R4UM16_COPFO|nr:hypothetical protein [Coptotermes formosanus]